MEMKKKVLLTGAALLSLSPMAVQKAAAATASVQMQAIILQAVALASVSSLLFGTFSVTAGVNTVQVRPDGTKADSGGVNHIGGSVFQPGVVNVKASAGYPIDLSVTAAATVDDVGAGAPMNVNAFNIQTNAGGALEAVTLTAGQVAAGLDVPVGATLNVNAAQLAGTYTGAFTINGNYQ